MCAWCVHYVYQKMEFQIYFYQHIFKVSPSSFLEYINRFIFLKNSDVAVTRLHVPIFNAVSINFQFHRDKVRSRG